MKKIFILMVCLMAIAFAAEMIPAYISASAIKRQVLPATMEIKAECVYTGITNYPPWLDYGRDAPWSTDVQIPDVYDEDDVLTSMAEDALGRIYVCYETIYDDPPGPSVYWGWGMATSVDNGQTWDNRVYYAANLSVRYPEIAISDEGRIWIWGSLQGGSYNDDVIWLRSTSGTVNDPDDMDGFFWFGAGEVNNRTYPEVVTYGDTTQLVLSTWTYDNGTETVMAWIYATDGGASGTWSIYSLLDDTEPDGMTSIGVNYDGTNYIAIHGWEEDIGGGDWNVLCMIDTLDTGTGLSGWGTGNTNPDRYPSIFCSNGYAYIAYQGSIDAFNADIMFNYSTDYGENWAGIVDLTNDVTMETYPRLYGIDQTIGVDYVYGLNRVRFNYSLDNGITWLNDPELVDDNSTVNNSYHSVALLYTSGYWHAVWEDTRNSGTDGLEIYASGRNAGQGDITHRPDVVFFNYDWSFLGDISSEKYVLHHSENPIDEKLTEEIAESSPDEQIPVFVMLAKQMNYDWLIPRAEQMSKPNRRKFVIRECQTLANDDQKTLLAYLRQRENEHQVSDIVSQWTTNTICLKAKPEIIREIAQRNDIWGIGYSEPLQIIGVVATEEPAYEHIEFVPEDGREICWGVAKINADDVWALGYTGAGVIVGHMDSGVNYNHTDLSDHMWDGSGAGYPNHGYDFVDDDNNPMDIDGHGTQTSGIVAGDGTSGSQTGVAPDAQIMALRIYPGTNSEMGQAISFALTHNADLLSCSIGWSDPSNFIKNWCRGQSITIYAAGIVWCNAAGNGDGVGGHYAVPQDINSPADCPGPYYAPNGGNSASIALGATNQSDDVASWSSYGPTHWNTGTYSDYPYPPGLTKPDVAAPGVNCKSLDYSDINGYVTDINGTSFAQPHLAGMIALMLDKEPDLLPRQLDSIIQEYGVIDIDIPGRDNLSGAGRIDALLAVNAVSEGYRAKTVWIINQETATGMLQVTDITQDENEPWLIGITPTKFNVPIDDSVAVIVSVDTTGLGYSQGSYHYDTLLVWSNTVVDDYPERVPVILLMATIGIEEDEDLAPRANANLLSMLPNPFRTSIQIDYAIPWAQDVNFTIYDVCGKKVKTLVDGYQEPGQFSVTWTGCDEKGRKLAAGIYFGRIEVGKNAVTNKLILIR